MLNLKIPINLGKIEEIYFELKGQEYTLEEKYKNILDIVNDLKKRINAFRKIGNRKISSKKIIMKKK